MSISIISFLSSSIISFISKFSYFGIFILMFLESCNIPIPSEVIMTFAGFLVFEGHMNLILVGIIGGVGSLFGSIISYYIGYYGGYPIVNKYGRYFFVSHKDLNSGISWIGRYGDIVAFLSRILPVVRTFISLPAGILKMKISKFVIFSFLGSLIWSFFLTIIGFYFGYKWKEFSGLIQSLSNYILILVILALVFYILRHIINFRRKG